MVIEKKPFRAKEYQAFFNDHKDLLNREHDEKCIIKASKKRLKSIQRSINKNNEWLRNQ